jgi:uncharacterized LabA/DUF88 family protein
VDRVRAYIDGFNLYYGLKARYGHRFLWMDVQELVTSLLLPGQRLEQVTYFTTRVRDDPPAEQRQSDYLDALAAHCTSLTVVSGRFQQKERHCRACGATWVTYEEKETDVSIATTLVADGLEDLYDTALLVSGDSDLSPAVRMLKRLRPGKRVVVVFPPRRQSTDLRTAADGFLFLGDDKVRRAQLPDPVAGRGAVVLHRPKHWS